MEAFTHLHPLKLGDVVRVPTWLPHSLQHGVRVVEFQTPTYERLILSFAQKVLTQSHWDTDSAIDRVVLDPPQAQHFESVANGIERIAEFDDFNVWRVDFAQHAAPITLPATLPYAVCMSVKGRCTVGELSLNAEEACLVPKQGLASTTLTSTDGLLLIAAPGL